LIGGAAGAVSLGAAGFLLYRQFQSFWRQYFREMQIPILPPAAQPKPAAWPTRGLHAAWLGHSTVFLQVDGFTILTDPVFSPRAGIDLKLLTLGLKRRIAPAVAISHLPPVDLILVSHAHMDHLDTPSLRSLESPKTNVVMAPSTSDLIRPQRYGKVTELAWGEQVTAGAARIKAFEVNHWGARMRTDTYRGYNGYLIEIAGKRILFGGDTAVTGAFRHVKTMRGIDLAIMPIGAYNPWIRYHCTPEQAWRMSNDAGAQHIMPVHHKTFALGREPVNEPIERFLNAAGSRPERIVTRSIGEEFHLT
jgi:L-ascorbate metabolism protein UlaG (beta-lactamase superfamily)